MRLDRLALLLLIVLPQFATASGWSSLYERHVLETEKPRLQHELDDLLERDIRPYLNEQESHALAGVQIELPVMGPNKSPVEFFADKGHLAMPLLTLQFTEDLAKAYAWLWANHYSSETVDEYMGMLHFQQPGAFAGGRYPPPLTALHIPENALDMPAVRAMFARVRTTAWSFLFLHEFAHLRNAQQSEQQADLFALEILKRNSEVPSGLLLIVHAMLYLPVDHGETHALTSQRLTAMADYFDLRVHEFAQGRKDAHVSVTAIHLLASRLRYSAAWLQDAQGQQIWAEEAKQRSLSRLAPRPLR